MKHEDHFVASITVSEGVDPDTVFLPPMLLQPFVENAIKHGLLPRSEGGRLEVRFAYLDDALQVVISDDGIGRKAAAERREKSLRAHRSLGTSILEERVRLLNELGYDITVDVRNNEPSGTVVDITIAE